MRRRQASTQFLPVVDIPCMFLPQPEQLLGKVGRCQREHRDLLPAFVTRQDDGCPRHGLCRPRPPVCQCLLDWRRLGIDRFQHCAAPSFGPQFCRFRSGPRLSLTRLSGRDRDHQISPDGCPSRRAPGRGPSQGRPGYWAESRRRECDLPPDRR